MKCAHYTVRLLFITEVLMCFVVLPHVLNCKKAESDSGGPPINLFTQILQFPDRGAYNHSEPSSYIPTREPEIFAERFKKIYDARVAARGGRIPLEGSEKFAFEKEMMILQAGLLFDMRLGPTHHSKKKFLEIVAWTFDQRMPIIEKRKPYIMADEKSFKRAEELDFQLHEKLLEQVKKKMKQIFTPEEYKKMTGEPYDK